MTEAQHPARRILETLQAQQHDGAVACAVDGSLANVYLDGDFNLEEVAKAVFPYSSGDHTVIGPECFTDGSTISYKGVTYVAQPEDGPHLDDFNLDVTTTTDTGIQLPMKLILSFPKGYGFYAAKTLQKFGDDDASMNHLYTELVRRGDVSTLTVMAASPNNRGDDDE